MKFSIVRADSCYWWRTSEKILDFPVLSCLSCLGIPTSLSLSSLFDSGSLKMVLFSGASHRWFLLQLNVVCN